MERVCRVLCRPTVHDTPGARRLIRRRPPHPTQSRGRGGGGAPGGGGLGGPDGPGGPVTPSARHHRPERRRRHRSRSTSMPLVLPTLPDVVAFNSWRTSVKGIVMTCHRDPGKALKWIREVEEDGMTVDRLGEGQSRWKKLDRKLLQAVHKLAETQKNIPHCTAAFSTSRSLNSAAGSYSQAVRLCSLYTGSTR